MRRTHTESRQYDVVLWGATGFTGRLVAEYLVEGLGASKIRLALGGRSPSKLEALRGRFATQSRLAADLPIIVADSFDRSALDAMTAGTKVVCSTVGPYATFGHELVAACVEAGTDYCDLTGEVPFIREMIDRHHERARITGARIVHCCGFDSIPSDLGTLMLHEAAADRFDARLDGATLIVGASRGGISGGTVASLTNVIEEARTTPSVRRIVNDPYALNPEGDRHGPDGPDLVLPRFDDELCQWTGPFVMASINTRVVRRSNALLDWRYGRDFRYAEVTGFPSGVRGRLGASAISVGLGGFVAALSWGPTRWLLKKILLPSPGEGPSRETRENGFFNLCVHGRGRTADGERILLEAHVQGQNDPGYGATAKMLGESALCLALDEADCRGAGGVLTPAVAMGQRLLHRLRRAGMIFEVR